MAGRMDHGDLARRWWSSSPTSYHVRDATFGTPRFWRRARPGVWPPGSPGPRGSDSGGCNPRGCHPFRAAERSGAEVGHFLPQVGWGGRDAL